MSEVNSLRSRKLISSKTAIIRYGWPHRLQPGDNHVIWLCNVHSEWHCL